LKESQLINEEIDLPRQESVKTVFKIISSLEKIEMELAKGQITVNSHEMMNKETISVKMMSTAIPENISKKPKIMKKFKEDFLKKIENETQIGELQIEINEEIMNYKGKSDNLKEKETPIYYLFMNIDKISNVK